MLRTSPYVEGYFRVWQSAESPDSSPTPGLIRATEAALAIKEQTNLSEPWALLLDEHLLYAKGFSDLLVGSARIPEVVQTSSGEVRSREQYDFLVAELLADETLFLSQVWPQSRTTIQHSVLELEALLEIVWCCVLLNIEADLLVECADTDISCFLITTAPFERALALVWPDGRGEILVEIENSDTVSLMQVIIHEAIHVLTSNHGTDPGAIDAPTVLDAIRSFSDLDLENQGLLEAAIENAVHGVIEAEAVWITKRCVGADVGVGQDMTAAPRVAQAAYHLWLSYLQGKMTQNEAIDGIGSAIRAPVEQDGRRPDRPYQPKSATPGDRDRR